MIVLSVLCVPTECNHRRLSMFARTLQLFVRQICKKTKAQKNVLNDFLNQRRITILDSESTLLKRTRNMIVNQFMTRGVKSSIDQFPGSFRTRGR